MEIQKEIAERALAAKSTATLTQRDLYPIPEVRQRLGGISHTSFYEIVKRCEIKIVKIGRRSFVTAAEIGRYVASLQEMGEAYHAPAAR